MTSQEDNLTTWLCCHCWKTSMIWQRLVKFWTSTLNVSAKASTLFSAYTVNIWWDIGRSGQWKREVHQIQAPLHSIPISTINTLAITWVMFCFWIIQSWQSLRVTSLTSASATWLWWLHGVFGSLVLKLSRKWRVTLRNREEGPRVQVVSNWVDIFKSLIWN